MIAVAFTGQDGTGKSTQLGLLRESLEARGLSVAVVHQYGPTTRIGSAVLPAAKGAANRWMRSSSGGSGGAAPARPRLAGRAAAALSLLIGWGRALRNRFVHRHRDVLILDRYFTDEILRARHKFASGERLGGWILRMGIPSPDLAFAFWLDPATGWERKKTRELTLDEYRRKVDLARDTLSGVRERWNLVEIPVDGLDAAAVFERVRERVETRLATDR